jgi:hypothetical protein
MISFITTNVYAYDIAVENEEGVTIYYNFINDGDSLEVTYNELWKDSYSGVVVIPGGKKIVVK